MQIGFGAKATLFNLMNSLKTCPGATPGGPDEPGPLSSKAGQPAKS